MEDGGGERNETGLVTGWTRAWRAAVLVPGIENRLVREGDTVF